MFRYDLFLKLRRHETLESGGCRAGRVTWVSLETSQSNEPKRTEQKSEKCVKWDGNIMKELTQLTWVFHEFLTSSRHNMFQSSKLQPQPRSGRDQVKELPLSVSSAILVRSSEAEWLKSADISGRKTRWTVLNSAKTLLNSCVSGCLSAFSRGLSCDQRGKYPRYGCGR